MPRSRATSAIGRPVSRTICTASALNCGLNRRRRSGTDSSSRDQEDLSKIIGTPHSAPTARGRREWILGKSLPDMSFREERPTDGACGADCACSLLPIGSTAHPARPDSMGADSVRRGAVGDRGMPPGRERTKAGPDHYRIRFDPSSVRPHDRPGPGPSHPRGIPASGSPRTPVSTGARGPLAAMRVLGITATLFTSRRGRVSLSVSSPGSHEYHAVDAATRVGPPPARWTSRERHPPP
ncbi:MAG: hypothetical protein QOC68_4537 [Solirubrobacteraceae bacterium]|nr:hypothetical protein [Solirubrobacteraceae bacterium]